MRQNLEVFARLYGVRAFRERIEDLSRELKLHEFLDRPYGSLSAGQRTRVSLAKALLNAPELLLLDEPTASLDPDTADWVRSRLEEFCVRGTRQSFSPPTTWPRSSAWQTASSCSNAAKS